MLEKRDHKYMALGILSGLLAIPFGVFISTFIMIMSHVKIRTTIETVGDPTFCPNRVNAFEKYFLIK